MANLHAVPLSRRRGIAGLRSLRLHELFGGAPLPGPDHDARSLDEAGHLEQGVGGEHADREYGVERVLGARTLGHQPDGVRRPSLSKPTINSSLNDIIKFVQDKYVKRKYVDPEQSLDPLKRSKLPPEPKS
jgi:hypothetical protein